MKKKLTLMFVALIAVAAFATTQMLTSRRAATAITIGETELTAANNDVFQALKTAKDAVVEAGGEVGDITINLAAKGSYTLSGVLEAPANLTINGKGATIDASTEGADNIIGIKGVTAIAPKADGDPSTYAYVSAITIKDVTISGMKKALIRDYMENKTYLQTLTIDNCVIQASTAKVVVDFDSRGFVGNVVVKNSTIWAAAGTGKHFVKYGSRPNDFNNTLLQAFDVQNSTFVNIASNADFSGGANFNNFSQKGTANNSYTLKNNIFVNCGKNGQTVVGFNSGQTNATPAWDVDGNAFNWNGEDTSATEVSKAGKKNEVDIVQNSVVGVVVFEGAATGNFTLGTECAQYAAKIGDPRWIKYAVNVADGITNGTVKVDKATAAAGDEVTVTATPAEGCELKAITVTGVNTNLSVEVTDGKFIMPADDVTVNATFKDTRTLFDFVASGAAEETLTKVSLNFQVNMGEGKEDRTNRDFRGYKDYAGTILPAECQVALGEEMKVDAQGLIVTQNRYFAVYGLHTGDKVTILYSGVPEGKQPAYSVGTSVDTNAKIGEAALVSPTSAINSGDVIEITKAGSKNYIIMSVFSGMRIEKVYIQKAALYNVTKAENIVNGDIKLSAATAAAGDEVTVTATPAEGCELKAITVTGVNTNLSVEVTDGKFIMPADDVTVNATFVAIPKFYIIGNMNDWSLTSMTEMTFNAETQAYEYEYAPATAAAFAFSDVATSESWDDFNANHRYAIGEGDQDAKLNETVDLKKVNGAILLAAGTYKISVAKDKSTVTITGEVTPPTPVTVDKLYIMGTGTPKEWGGTTELTFNETTQAFEYEATVTTEEGTYLTFGDAEFTGWSDFNGKHRYAPGEGNTEAVVDAEVQLVLVNDGNVLLKTPGTYKISVTKDLKMTITTGGTGINGIYVDGEAADIFSDGKPVYNLSGQRVFKGYKGVVIKNGKKIVVK